jgi:HPr kinase/phosphorylase
VLGMGVMITGDSGVGKSELALELISRGSGLIADDVIELYRIAPETLEARCPLLLRDFLEVRGLGVLNIRTIFGEAALRPRKNLRLIVHLEKPAGTEVHYVERLPLKPGFEEIMGVSVSKVTIPVAAGRNLAVLVEAAVRNHVLQLRGIDSTQDFISRQAQQIEKGEQEIGQ